MKNVCVGVVRVVATRLRAPQIALGALSPCHRAGLVYMDDVG